MAIVRVYLFYYRRPKTLERALRSLLNQSFRDWICELHNDDPADDFPCGLVRKFNDPRIIYVQHPTNLGAVESFRLAWVPIEEPYMSILEDDNWWEETFLERMVHQMDRNPGISVAWSNMRFWRENSDESWTRGHTIWPIDEGNLIEIFREPVPAQLMQNIHSNGAMLVRIAEQDLHPYPRSLPFFMIEAARERNFIGPLMLVRDPLANFALTLSSARNEDASIKLGGLAMLVNEFIRNNRVSIQFYQEAWRYKWWAGRMSLRAIVLGTMFAKRFDIMLFSGRQLEVLLAFAWFLRHPFITISAFKFMLKETELRLYIKGRN
jgi:glycosyltransferase involved in cell wall biosynthesis